MAVGIKTPHWEEIQQCYELTIDNGDCDFCFHDGDEDGYNVVEGTQPIKILFQQTNQLFF